MSVVGAMEAAASRRWRWRLACVLALAVVAALGVSLGFAPRAEAASCTDNGRACNRGYFTNNGPFYSGTDVFLDGVEVGSAGALISTMSSRLGCSGGAITISQNGISAAFTVLTMLGAGPGTNKNQACSRFSEWTARINQYNSAGLIHWNELRDFGCVNTAYRGADVFYYRECGSARSIVFYSKGGSVIYAIKRDCGNPIGELNALPAIPTPSPPPPPPPPVKPPTPTPPPPVKPPTPTPPSPTPTPPTPTPPPPTPPPVTVGPPVCDGFSVSPAALDPNTPYSLAVGVRYPTANDSYTVLARPDTRFFLTISGPGVSATYPSVTPVVPDGSGRLRITASQPPTGQTGTYIVGWGISGSLGTVNCGAAIPGNANPPSFVVTAKPYFQVTNGGISAGAGMSINGKSCPAGVPQNPKGGIVGWNRGTSYSYAGSGTTHDAVSLGFLQDFVTGKGSSLPPTGASFANNIDGKLEVGNGLYGGNIGGVDCIPDYYAGASNVQKGNVTIGATNIPNCTGSNDAACRQTIYVEGNVMITGNIVFTGNGSYPNVRQIPSFTLVVKGNIYIAPGVTQLDGNFIAVPGNPTSPNGVIYTCAPSSFTPAVLNYGLASSCANRLTVNGSFTARQVWLLRTASTLSSGVPAETFNYSPEVWLSVPSGGAGQGGRRNYNSITSLPPVL